MARKPQALSSPKRRTNDMKSEDPLPIWQSERREALSFQLCQCQQCGFSSNTDEFELYVSGKFTGFTCPHCDSNELKILK